MKNVIAALQKVENFILAASFIVMTLSAFAQVVNRNLVGAGISWFEELARYCMVYMALLGTEVGLRDGTQIAITAVVDRFHGAFGKIVVIAGKMVVVAFSATVFVHSWNPIMKQIRFGQLSPGLEIPMWLPYAALPPGRRRRRPCGRPGARRGAGRREGRLMDTATIGFVLFGSLALLLVFGVPIAMSLGVSAAVCLVLMDLPLAAVPQRIFTALDAYAIMAIPFFVLAGNFMTSGGISRRLVAFVNSLVGRVRGGMAYAMVLACAFFAALSGSAPATVIAIGSTIYPEIVALGYPKERSAGLLAVSGGLGPIIPPSIIMVIYGTITNSSISNLFSAGIVAGSMIVAVLVILCSFYAKKEQWPKHVEAMSLAGFIKTVFMAVPALMLPVIILGGIYSGILTPTESAAVSVVYAFLVGVFLYRAIPLKEAVGIVVVSAKSSAMMLFIIATSTAFSWVFTMSGISGALVGAIKAMDLSPLLFTLVVSLILLVFGTFLEGIAICVLLVPVLWPIAESMGIHSVHFGMLVCLSNVIGTMTPPVAVNLFAASSVTRLTIGAIAKGELPFFIGYTCVFFIMVLFPWFSTFFI